MSNEETALSGTEELTALIQESQKEYDQIQTELKEIDVLIRQSTTEVEKLAQRNTQIANRTRQMEMNIETYPREDIREIYTAANEAQMRLFMMRAQLEQLQIVRVIDAQENERLRLSRQMHDGPAQSLTNLALQAEICERLFDTDPLRARVELGNLKNAVNTTFEKIRGFIATLRPMMLDDLGLVPTLKNFVQDFEEKKRLSTNFTVIGRETRLPSHTEVTIFRVIQELLDNVYAHAHASHVQVVLDFGDGAVVASVEDDGSGFDVAEAQSPGQQRKGLGLSTIQERAEMLGGQMQIESRIGRGTKVRIEIPVVQQ
jgi:two-component system sensor histidine kinase DegS